MLSITCYTEPYQQPESYSPLNPLVFTGQKVEAWWGWVICCAFEQWQITHMECYLLRHLCPFIFHSCLSLVAEVKNLRITSLLQVVVETGGVGPTVNEFPSWAGHRLEQVTSDLNSVSPLAMPLHCHSARQCSFNGMHQLSMLVLLFLCMGFCHIMTYAVVIIVTKLSFMPFFM